MSATVESRRAERGAALGRFAASLAILGLSAREQVDALAGGARELPPAPSATGLERAHVAYHYVSDVLANLPRMSPELVARVAREAGLDKLPASWRRRLVALVARKVARAIRAGSPGA